MVTNPYAKVNDIECEFGIMRIVCIYGILLYVRKVLEMNIFCIFIFKNFCEIFF